MLASDPALGFGSQAEGMWSGCQFDGPILATVCRSIRWRWWTRSVQPRHLTAVALCWAHSWTHAGRWSGRQRGGPALIPARHRGTWSAFLGWRLHGL